MLHLKASVLHLCIGFHFKEEKQQTPSGFCCSPLTPKMTTPQNTSQSPSSTPAVNENEVVGVGRQAATGWAAGRQEVLFCV